MRGGRFSAGHPLDSSFLGGEGKRRSVFIEAGVMEIRKKGLPLQVIANCLIGVFEARIGIMRKMKELTTYGEAVQAIKTAILEGQHEAAKGVNRIQLAVYFGVGRYLSKNTRKRTWGQGALEAISEQLRREMPGLRGFSAINMKLMRLFYEEWQMLDAKPDKEIDDLKSVNSLVATNEFTEINSHGQIIKSQDTDSEIDVFHAINVSDLKDFPVEDFFNVPFTHHSRIIGMAKTLEERYYYIHRCAEEHLSVEALKRLIKEDAFHHQHLMPNNFARTLSNAEMARKAVMMFKDEYLLNFINVEEIGERDSEDVDERVVEQQIVKNVKDFIMTFGHDFAFMGNQYHLEAYAEEFFPDLLFFNRELNAMVVVELKTGKFKPSYLGQLTTYLRILDDKVRKPHENPTIGIVLCKSANREFVEYVIQDYDKPMGVATYTTSEEMPERLRKALPDIEDLRRLLGGEKEKGGRA